MDRKDRKDIARGILLITQLGLTTVVPLLIFLFIGIRFREHIGSFGLVICVLLGIAGGALGAWKMAKSAEASMKKEEKEEYDLMAAWHEEEETPPHEK